MIHIYFLGNGSWGNSDQDYGQSYNSSYNGGAMKGTSGYPTRGSGPYRGERDMIYVNT